MGDNEIRNNLVYLTENIGNLHGILIRLMQDGTISINDKEEIESENTSQKRNIKLLRLIQMKDWQVVKDRFLEILRQTNNEHCADKFEIANESEVAGVICITKSLININKPFQNSGIRKYEKLGKWWPDKKRLTESLHKRKHGEKLLVEELHDRIKTDKNRMVAICESTEAAKFSGMGGIGKTLTATWYAHHYEDYYDHILWVDCGEGSLLASFKNLAMELETKNWDKYVETNEFARKCFEILSGFKCLWIFDNAESYQGKEGIIKVLPNYQENFFCIITSRSGKWGIENIGYGKISELHLGIFSQEESLEFLHTKLTKEIKYSAYELNELCRLLGNLPLALQLAVAALNSSKMEVQTYLQKSKFVKVLDAKFDDYEKTINGNVKVSLSLIQKEEGGTTAMEILRIFGYIRPVDIQLEFFQSALQIPDAGKIKKSLKILTKYSLVSKTKIKVEDEEEETTETKLFFSIHRLLQQVIRHNGKQKEKETLRKVIGCDGFIDYKLLPFTKYGDEMLRIEFPKVKAELLDQQQLRKLKSEERFYECVQLSKFIDQEIKNNTTKFNYAICLHKNGQLGECVKTLEKLYEQAMEKEIKYGLYNVEMGLLSLDREVSRELVGGHLLLAYFKMNHKQKAKEVLKMRKQFSVIDSQENLGIAIRLVHSDLITSNYFLAAENSFINLRLDVQSETIKLRFCSLSLSSFDRISPEELTLDEVYFFRDDQEIEQVTVNDFLDLTNINKLTLKCIDNNKNLSLRLNGNITMDYLELRNVQVLTWRNSNWNLKQLELDHVPFLETTNINVQEMTIYFSLCDVSCLPKTIQKINLFKTEVFVSGGVELQNLNYVTLRWVSDVDSLSHFHSAPLTHIHLDQIKGEVNVDFLPQSLAYLRNE